MALRSLPEVAVGKFSTRFRESLLKGETGPIRLHLGGDGERPPGWMTLHAEAENEPDILHDVRTGLPFIDGSVAAIYLAHVLQTLSLTDGLRFLADAFRVLEPGGQVRIAVPDLELFTRAYVKRDVRFFERDYASEGGPWNGSVTEGFLAALYGWGHCCAYDYELLEAILRRSGFAGVRRSRLGESQHAAFRDAGLDTRPRQSLFVEAVRPSSQAALG
jgi:SAM-dependent methyltransferase